MTSTYTVTNRRLITRQGILTRTGRDIPLFRINDVAYEKGLLDRLVGCGTLIISDATEKAGVVLPDIPHVERVQLQISELLFANDDGNDDDGSRVPGEPPRNNR
jgi:membrane protein YdbS with pleckstrin-like domain